MGPYESYADKHHASWHGSFSASIDEMHEDYIMPQENGSHFDCSLVQVSAPGASDESDRNSSDKNNFVNGSSYQSICNAQTAEKYRFDEDEWEFGFTMHVK